MDPKPILTSRTFWVQVVAVGILLLSLTGKADIFDEETQSAIVGGLWAVANVLMRLLTTGPVTLR